MLTQLAVRKILNEAEIAFQAMTAIEMFAVENNRPYPVKPFEYVNLLFDLANQTARNNPTDPKLLALLDLNIELI